LKTKWQHIIESGNCPNIDQLKDYANDVLLPKDRFEVENHLLTCEMCNDALEGLNLLDNSEHLPEIEQKLKTQLWQMLEQKEERARKIVLFRRLSLAASILLIVGVSVWLYQSNNSLEINRLQLGQDLQIKEIKKKEPSSLIIAQKDKSKTKPIRIAQNQNKKAQTNSDQNIEVNEMIASAPAVPSEISLPAEESQSLNDVALLSKSAEAELKKGKISGRIKDSKGEPMPDVNLRVSGTNKYSVSDSNGNFAIESPSDTAQIEASFIGYENSTVLATSESEVSILLKEEKQELLTVIRDRATAVSRVESTISNNQMESKEEKKLAKSDNYNSASRRELSDQKQPSKPKFKIDKSLSIWEFQKSKAIYNIQLNNYPTAITHLDTLLQLTLNANKKTDIQNILELLKQQKADNALRLLKSLKQE
jgi:hypothetical protein